jgi:hypothetical protein
MPKAGKHRGDRSGRSAGVVQWGNCSFPS